MRYPFHILNYMNKTYKQEHQSNIKYRVKNQFTMYYAYSKTKHKTKEKTETSKTSGKADAKSRICTFYNNLATIKSINKCQKDTLCYKTYF